MPMIPPLVLEPPSADPRTPGAPRAPFAGHPVASRMARPQRRYASNYNISFIHEPAKPMAPPKPEPAPESTFDKWRAAADAERERLGIDGAGPDDAAVPGPAPRRRLHDALLGTTAVVLLGMLGGIVHFAWTHDAPAAASPGGTAAKEDGLSAFVQPLVALVAKVGPQAAPDGASAPAAEKDVAAAVPSLPQAPQLAALLPQLSAAPDGPAPATLFMDKPALAVPAAPASGAPAAPGEALPVPERAAAALAAPAQLSEPTTAPPAAAMPPQPAPMVERMAAQAVPPALPREPDALPPVPAIATATVRLAPAPEWAAAGVVPLAPPPEAAALPLAPAAAPPAPAGPTPAAGSAMAVPAEMARAILPGVDAQQVVSTMQLVQQMSLLVHDMHGDSLRYRTEVTELTGAVQEKAAILEERLKRAEARSASGAEAGWRRPGTAPAAGDLGDSGELRAAAEASRTLRRYHVQAGSADAVVLSDGNAGPEQAARLLVIVGDQVPGVGRVRAIVQRGRSWLVQTEHGEIR